MSWELAVGDNLQGVLLTKRGGRRGCLTLEAVQREGLVFWGERNPFSGRCWKAASLAAARWRGRAPARGRAHTAQRGASEALQHRLGTEVGICTPLVTPNRSGAAPGLSLSQKE